MHTVVYAYVELYIHLKIHDSILFLQIPVRPCGLTRIYYVRICVVVAVIVITLWLCSIQCIYNTIRNVRLLNCKFAHTCTQFAISQRGHIALHRLHGCNYMHDGDSY